MSLAEAIQEYETVKQTALPTLKRRNEDLPICRVYNDDSHWDGDGFFLSGDGCLSLKQGGLGYNTLSDPEHLVEAYKTFGKDYTIEQACRQASQAINCGYLFLV